MDQVMKINIQIFIKLLENRERRRRRTTDQSKRIRGYLNETIRRNRNEKDIYKTVFKRFMKQRYKIECRNNRNVKTARDYSNNIGGKSKTLGIHQRYIKRKELVGLFHRKRRRNLSLYFDYNLYLFFTYRLRASIQDHRSN